MPVEKKIPPTCVIQCNIFLNEIAEVAELLMGFAEIKTIIKSVTKYTIIRVFDITFLAFLAFPILIRYIIFCSFFRKSNIVKEIFSWNTM